MHILQEKFYILEFFDEFHMENEIFLKQFSLIRFYICFYEMHSVQKTGNSLE